MTMLANTWTALVTPFKNDQSISWEDLNSLLDLQSQSSNGLLIFGSTGEGMSLTLSEKKEMLEFVKKKKLKNPLMLGLGGISLEDNLQLIKSTENDPIWGYLLTTPLYCKPQYFGQVEWFRKHLNSTSKNFMFYNNPSRTGVSLLPSVVEELQDFQNFCALKESGGNWNQLMEYSKVCSSVSLFCGDDPNIAPWSRITKGGLVSVLANCWPKEVSYLVDQCINENSQGPTPLKLSKWNDLTQEIFRSTNPLGIKTLLKNKNIISSNQVRYPLDILDQPDLNQDSDSFILGE